MNTNAISDQNMMFNNCARSYTDIIADHVTLSHRHPVSGLKAPPNLIAGVDHRMRPDEGTLTDHGLQVTRLMSTRWLS